MISKLEKQYIVLTQSIDIQDECNLNHYYSLGYELFAVTDRKLYLKKKSL